MKHPVLVVSDVHFHTYKPHSTMVDGINSRLLDVANAFVEAFDIAHREGCKVIAIPGDLFHVRGAVKSSVMKKVGELLKMVVEAGIDVILLAGNHDMENLKGGATSLWPLQFIQHGDARVHVVETPTVIESGGHTFSCIPYVHSAKEFKEVFERSLSGEGMDSGDVIHLIHQGVDDFRPGAGIPETSITADWLASKAGEGWVFAGHYHKPFQKGRVISPGAPIQHNFGDAGQDRGCWILLPNGETKFFKLSYPEFETHEVETLAKAKKIDVSGKIVRWKVKTAKQGEKLIAHALESGAVSATSFVEKEFVAAHEQTVKINAPEKMFEDYLEMFPEKYTDERKKRLITLFHHICTQGVDNAQA